LLVNVSRAIIFASANSDFAEKAEAEARLYQQQMAALMGLLLPL
jgi:hypothetical protein